MPNDFPQDWIDYRNKQITHAKAQTISKLFGMANSMIYGGGSEPDAGKDLKFDQLHGHDHYAVIDGIEKFLVGAGTEDTGFIGQILAANDTEEFRAVVNAHGGVGYASEDMEPSVENVLKYAKAWLARNAWMGLQLDLLPLKRPGEKPALPALTGPQ